MDHFDSERAPGGRLACSACSLAAEPPHGVSAHGAAGESQTALPEAVLVAVVAMEPRPEPVPAGGALPIEWFHRHFDTLWRLVARLGVAGHAVDDVVQEAFIAASRRRADIGEGQERRFLIAAAIRLSSNFRQRAHVRREVSASELLEQEPSATPDAEQLLVERRLRALLDEALASLSDMHREVFVLYELEGFSAVEIAQLLGVPGGTVASRLARARASFAKAAARSQRSLPRRSEER